MDRFVTSDNHGLRILVVEDDEDARDALTDILELANHIVRSAGSVEAAFVRSEDLADTDVVILDRNLPDGLAEELIPEFRSRMPQADIIVVSGFADLDSTIAALREGAVDYLIKPINPDALLPTLRRLLERRRMEEELQQERRFAELILQTAEAIVLLLDTEGRVVRFNPYLAELSGFSPAEIQGCDWFKTFIPEADRESTRKVFDQTIGNVATRGILNPIVTKTGKLLDFRWSNKTVRNDHGQTSGVLSVGLDVSDLVQAQKQLLQSERLATIGQTMTGMAHESRNALQRIQNATELLQDDLTDNLVALRDVAKIERACNDLRDLLDEVRRYAAPIHLDLVETPLASVWRKSWSGIKSRTKDRHVIFLEVSKVDCLVRIDQRRMEQVFRKLFENALDACDDPVEIRLESIKTSDAIIVGIQDNGPGMSPELKGNIFDAFFTTKATGTGLGLAIVRRIIEAHHGEIAIVDSQLGAKFEIRLPYSHAFS